LRSRPLEADFGTLYTGGLILHEGNASKLYNLDEQMRMQEQFLKRKGLWVDPYPPFEAMLWREKVPTRRQQCQHSREETNEGAIACRRSMFVDGSGAFAALRPAVVSLDPASTRRILSARRFLLQSAAAASRSAPACTSSAATGVPPE
jgi:hypothetical protein